MAARITDALGIAPPFRLRGGGTGSSARKIVRRLKG